MTVKEFEQWVIWRGTGVDKLPKTTFMSKCDEWGELPARIRNKIIKIIYGSEVWEDYE